MKFSDNKGFTLVEVIIAVAILSIIATTIAVAFTKFSRINMHNEVTRENRETVISDLENDIDNKNRPSESAADDYEVYDAKVKVNFSETGVSITDTSGEAVDEFDEELFEKKYKKLFSNESDYNAFKAENFNNGLANNEVYTSIIERKKIYTRSEAEDPSKNAHMTVGIVKEVSAEATS